MARENNQIAVVTGSNTGVGLAVAKRLLAEAAKASLSLTVYMYIDIDSLVVRVSRPITALPCLKLVVIAKLMLYTGRVW